MATWRNVKDIIPQFEEHKKGKHKCTATCENEYQAEFFYTSVAWGNEYLALCPQCAKKLLKLIIGDLCELETDTGRKANLII